MAMRRRPDRYHTLLRIRRRQEDLHAYALAAARREVQLAQVERRRITEEQQRTLDRAAELGREHFDASDLRRYYQYERHLARLGDTKDALIRDLEQVADERRTELEEATKAKRVVEKLVEHRMAAYQDELRKLEQKTVDEVATSYAARDRLTQRQGDQNSGRGGNR